ncbi:CBS domain-containing protein [Halorhabdus rudnickae]|uniref:CBS domain-containing protein n=1 Tax=Halorhabdus rudnickae TaxID=1775544 RepID=UPI00108264E7|nr:CBS domain-containing protein [Halorhabdus rudnickae]
MSVSNTIREVMTRDYVGVSESDDLLEAGRLLREEGVDGAVVLRGNKPVGMLEVDAVLDAILKDGTAGTVSDVMADSIERVDAGEPIEVAADRLVGIEGSLLVVTDEGGDTVGVVTASDLVRAMALGREPEQDTTGNLEPNRTEGTASAGDSYSNQGICERCGALTSELVSFNGQLLCSDCRDI